MKRIGKYLRVHEETGDTFLPEIVNNKGETIGEIEYKNGWRQFVFLPCDEMLFNHRCLTDISAYLMELNKTKGAYKVKK